MNYFETNLSYSSNNDYAFMVNRCADFLREGVVLTTSPSKNCAAVSKNALEFGDIR